MIKMNVNIYAPLMSGEYNDEPMECVVEGKDDSTALESLKNDFNEIIIATLKTNKCVTGTYLVEVAFEQNGEYLDSEEPAEFRCDIENGVVALLKG